MDLSRARRLLTTEPNTARPLGLLVEVLAAAVELPSVEQNDFAWSSWRSKDEAIAEIEPLLRVAESGTVPDHAKVWFLFAPTGPIQEVSVSSGWGEALLTLAERFDTAERVLWPPPSGAAAG